MNKREQSIQAAQIDVETVHLTNNALNAVRDYSQKNGLTMSDLAAGMGVGPGRVAQIESGVEGGKRPLTLRTLAALSVGANAEIGLSDFSVGLSNETPGLDLGQ